MIKKICIIIFIFTIPLNINSKGIILDMNKIIFSKNKTEKVKIKWIDKYFEKMAYLESSNNYTAVNSLGYMGKYQFGKKTLKSLIDKNLITASYDDLKVEKFINNNELQENAMIALTNSNLEVLKRYNLIKHVGKKIKGINITLEGMLAVSHLLGPFAAKQFIKSNGEINKMDSNKTSASKYFKLFENV